MRGLDSLFFWFVIVAIAIVLAPFVWFAQQFMALPLVFRIALVVGVIGFMAAAVIYHEADRRRNARYQASEKTRLALLRASGQR